jgi:cobalt-zinc-cadmium efflux system membrane fusion protein
VRSDQSSGPLFVVSDSSSLWVQIDAREEHLRYIKTGTEFKVRYPAAGAEATGRITFVSDQVDPSSRTIKLRGLVANPDHVLKADAYVTAQFTVPAGDEPRVRGTAIFLMGDRTYVFVASGEREFVRKEVKVSAEHDGWMRVSHGLAAGDRVVTEGNLHLQRLLPTVPAQPAAPPAGPPGKNA